MISALSRALDREFTIYDILGRGHHIQLRWTYPALITRTSITFILTITTILTLLDPEEYLQFLSLPLSFVIWISGLVIFVAGYMVQLTLWSALPVRTLPSVPVFFFGFPGFVLSTLYHVAMAEYLTDGAWKLTLWPHHIFLLIAQQGFEAIFLRYAMPGAVREVRARYENKEDPQPTSEARSFPILITPPSSIEFGEFTLSTDRILFARAQEHYLEIQMTDETITIRARMTDFLDKVGDLDGIQPHRSWWVSRNAAPLLMTKEGKRVLHVAHHTDIPIARGRIEKVECWLG
ncbi:LytTR family DNA-binding domain-containing protein [Donghicola tyrosinivorans]|uniref:LytTr DNA-binding domain-containing protein n=1 Tax=Donghicola tyrosinivorans TaxID=1652492 RepID=A0A2T0X579_9RHOB|nr:LytTR family DNA-binding domain-containing protein [Donghicola tyrosinivorans]PRY94090.1 LytTr DNA-binding domain-containing protein [Donghicola tyrosinivorans]